jgi:type I restriction enzyme S subunit
MLTRGMTLFKDVPVCLVGRELAFNQDIKMLKVGPQLDSVFLAYYLISRKARLMRLVDASGHGTGRLGTDALLSFRVSFPNLPEQRRIGALLSQWDAAVTRADAVLRDLRGAYARQGKSLMAALLSDGSAGG